MKDAKGHGSEKRGGAMSSDLSERIRQAKTTLARTGDEGLQKVGRANINLMQRQLQDADAAAALAAPGNPKSVAAPVHPDASGRADAFYKNLEARQRGRTFPKHGYMPNDPGNRPGKKPTDL